MNWSFYQQWSSLIKTCNWYDFTWIKLETEYAATWGDFEVVLGVLGFILTVRFSVGEGDLDFQEQLSKFADKYGLGQETNK